MTRPASIPPGLVVELSRCKVLPGASAEADRWMRMLNDRLDECVASLDRERMAIEIVFRLKEGGDEYLFWVSVEGTWLGRGRAAGADAARSGPCGRPRLGAACASSGG